MLVQKDILRSIVDKVNTLKRKNKINALKGKAFKHEALLFQGVQKPPLPHVPQEYLVQLSNS